MRQLSEIFQFFWMFESQHHQRLAWRDAEEMRIARARADAGPARCARRIRGGVRGEAGDGEARAEAQHKSMMNANPSGQLGHSVFNDEDALRKSGLIE